MNRPLLTTAITCAIAAAGTMHFTTVSAMQPIATGLANSVAAAQEEIRKRTDRRRPGREVQDVDPREVEIDPARVRPVAVDPNDPDLYVPVPDRWRIMENLGLTENIWDPYNQNTYKADKPLFEVAWTFCCFELITLMPAYLLLP